MPIKAYNHPKSRWRILPLSILAALLSLGGVPFAHAQSQMCKSDNCTGDPAAWGAAFGSNPKARKAQQVARAAAQTALDKQAFDVGIEKINAIPPLVRDRLVLDVEDGLTQMASAKAYVVSLEVFPSRGSFLYCGAAIYAGGAKGIFVLDLGGGITTLNASRKQFADAGCGRHGVVFR